MDYTAIEQDLRSRLEEKFDTETNRQAADALAVKMVKEVYEPIVKATDRRYSVVVELLLPLVKIGITIVAQCNSIRIFSYL